jgi:hypothetical protein
VHVGGATLHLRGSVKELFFEWLREHRPDLLERYGRLYARGAYIPADERRAIELRAGAPWARRPERQRFQHRGTGRRLERPPADPTPRREVRQDSLF